MRSSSLFLSILCCYHVSYTNAWISAPLMNHELHPTLIIRHKRRHHHLAGIHSSRVSHKSVCLISLDDTNEIMSSGTPIALVTAIVLFVAAQAFIHQLVSGNQGLGAYLKDGSGYNKSAFQPLNSQEENDKDPLSWLSLPKLDFVDVKGQEDALLVQELEEIRLEMNEKLQEGNIKEATLLRDKLEVVMEKSGFQYKPDESLK